MHYQPADIVISLQHKHRHRMHQNNNYYNPYLYSDSKSRQVVNVQKWQIVGNKLLWT